MDWLTKLSDPVVLAAIGAVLAALFGPTVWGKIKPFLPGSTPAPPADDDVADMLAAKRLAARFERLNCPEGKAAVQTMLTHFFHTA